MPIAFSRSGRSGAHGKNDQRVSADVSLSLLADIGALCQAFPGAREMNLAAATAALSALDGKTVDEYRDSILAMHIFGRLHVDQMIEEAGAEGQPENCPGSGRIPVGEGT